MKTAYRREMKHNYLIMEPGKAECEGYEIHMLEANRIEGLLHFHIKQVDNQRLYYYEITSKQPLSRVLEYHSLGGEELRKLTGDIGRTLKRLEVYLLDEKQILLEPEFIYVEPEQFTVFLCLVPGRQGGFPGEMTELLRYLLGKVNHQDKECVVMAYGLYQESLKENYGMKDLLQIAGKNCTSKKEGEAHIPQQEKELEESLMTSLPYTLDEELEERDRMFDGKKKGAVFIIPILVMFGMGACLWLVFGMEGLRKFWYGVPVMGAFTGFAVWKKEVKRSKEPLLKKEETDSRQPSESFDWQMTFEEDIKEKPPKYEKGEEEVFQTALLTDVSSDKNIRYLRAVGDVEDIAITYVPYLIGKQEGMVDYVLKGENVSRIHARIDRKGEEYWISDLNSTNGTTVNGRVLETNETVGLKRGDEVFIANVPFIFT